MEPESAKQIVTKIEASRRPVASVTVMGDGGSLAAVAKGASWVAEQLLAASRQKRELVPLSDLIIGVECGGSDTTSGIAANPAIGNAADALVDSGASIILSETSEWLGGEHLLARRADTPEIGGQILQAVAQIEQDAIQRGVDLVGQQPSYDNMKGGLSTIEEKTLGAIQKGGSRPIVGFLEYAQSPRKPGLHVMDTFAGAVESMTALSAGGCQIILFATGQGNPIGDQIAPTLKVCGNAETLSRLAEHVDIDVSAVISGLMSMEEAGALVLAATKELAEGRKCFCEILGQEETTISRFERSI
jgi:altronate dehydratase large subunit